MSYDLDEGYIDARKATRDTLETEITELQDLRQVFRVEDKEKVKKINREIDDAITTKREQVKAALDECIQHFLTVIGW